ncbi:MAG TPA: hypothetical protein VI146_08860 [Nitrososphaeraceae archaeon]
MNFFYNEFEVNSNIERVWEFYTDISHLEVITPSDIKLKIIQTSDQVLRKGAVACFSGKIIINAHWCSKITFFENLDILMKLYQMKILDHHFKHGNMNILSWRFHNVEQE